jgi:hypothetical protein
MSGKQLINLRPPVGRPRAVPRFHGPAGDDEEWITSEVGNTRAQSGLPAHAIRDLHVRIAQIRQQQVLRFVDVAAPEDRWVSLYVRFARGR